MASRAATGRSTLIRDVVLLGLVLLAIGLIIGPGLYTVDEGAYTAQARWVDEGGPWLQPPVVPDLGPGPEPAPLALSSRTDAGWAAFAKAPAYVGALVAARQLHAEWGPVALSGLALVVGAVVAGRLAERLAPGASRAGFWAVAAGSPLLFHAHVVWAHTLAAAAGLGALAAVVAGLDLVTSPGPGGDADRWAAVGGRRWGRWAAVAAGCLALAACLRAEALLLGPAIAAVLVVEAIRRPGWRPTLVGMAAASLAGSVLGHLLNAALVRRVLGATPPSRLDPDVPLAVADRITSAWSNLLAPGAASVGIGMARLASVLLLIWSAWVIARRRRAGEPAGWGPPVVATGAAVALGLVGALGSGTFHGLLPVVPALAVGTVGALGPSRPAGAVRLVAVAAAYAGLVVAASEPGGGGLGWGGRYVVGAAVLVAPVAAVGLRRLWAAGPPARVVVIGALAVTAAIQLAGIATLDRSHAATRAIAPDLAADLDQLAAEGGTLLTVDLRVGRVAADAARRAPLLSVPAGDAAATVQRVDHVLGVPPRLVTVADGRWPDLPPGWVAGPVRELRVLQVVTLEPVG